MPKFFVPNADSPEQAEEAYASILAARAQQPGKVPRIDYLATRRLLLCDEAFRHRLE
jgi:hypothetical protein